MKQKTGWVRLGLCGLALATAAVTAHADTVDTNPLNRTPEVKAAFDRFYIMDYDGALTRFEAIAAAHPQDAIATDYELDAVLFRELFRLDLLDTTFYANDGFLTGKHTVSEDPKVRDWVKQLADKAIGQADEVLKNKPDDVNALFARGWAKSLEATYLAMVERGFGAGMKLALGAKNDHDQVLKLDPNYVDAKMVVGIYQYVVGALPFGFKIIVGFAGIHGSKTTGMEMLHDSGSRGVITSVESRTAMTLFLRREAKYGEAYAMAKGLADQYPRDFLFNLEEANLLKDAGQWKQAIDHYHQVIADSRRADYYPESHLELAYFGLGETQRGQNFFPDAVVSYQAAAAEPGTSPELKRRCLLDAGMVYDLMNQHDRAKQEYQAVIDAGSESVQADQARKYEHSAYTGR